jgi:hypothetical protein
MKEIGHTLGGANPSQQGIGVRQSVRDGSRDQS